MPEHDRLCSDLLVRVRSQHIDPSAALVRPAPRAPLQPHLSPANAAFAQQRSLPVKATLQTLRLSAPEQALCALPDGSRTAAALRQAPAGLALGPRLDSRVPALWRAG